MDTSNYSELIIINFEFLQRRPDVFKWLKKNIVFEEKLVAQKKLRFQNLVISHSEKYDVYRSNKSNLEHTFFSPVQP